MRRDILEPICLKAEARTEHLGVFPSAQKAGNTWLETQENVQALQPPRGPLPFADLQS